VFGGGEGVKKMSQGRTYDKWPGNTNEHGSAQRHNNMGIILDIIHSITYYWLH